MITKGKDDWQFTMIDQCAINAELRRESFIAAIPLKKLFLNVPNKREESCL